MTCLLLRWQEADPSGQIFQRGVVCRGIYLPTFAGRLQGSFLLTESLLFVTKSFLLLKEANNLLNLILVDEMIIFTESPFCKPNLIFFLGISTIKPNRIFIDRIFIFKLNIFGDGISFYVDEISFFWRNLPLDVVFLNRRRAEPLCFILIIM